MLARTMRRALERILRYRGYELKEIGMPLRGFEQSLEHAKSAGIAPKTVIDIGVGRGTPWLYEAFPDAKLVLFEPLAIFNADLDGIAARYGADVHRVALGNARGTASFNLNVDAPTSSSLLEMDATYSNLAVHSTFARQTVPVETLDGLNTYEPPYLLKLDVESAELDVLDGAGETLQNTNFLIAEISVMRRMQEGPTFAEVIAYLDDRGYELFDIPSMSQVKGNGRLVYLDAAFVRKGANIAPEVSVQE